MKKNYLIILATGLFSSVAISQNFQEVNYSNLNTGKAIFADVDNDGDLDVLQYDDFTGSYLEFNDGNGVFTPSSNTFSTATDGEGIFLDIDNDNDIDLLLSGGLGGFSSATSLYTNDGSGNFSLVPNTSFVQVYNSAVDYADVDNDGDLDIMISGQYSSGSGYNRVTLLYTNDGNGNYTEVPGTTFIGVSYGSIDFADIDNDNDMDVLVTGFDGTLGSTDLYLNDGNGNFTSTPHPFPDLIVSDACFFDVDGDSDLDVLLAGDANFNNPTPKTELYTNDGTGNFTLATNTPFINVVWSSIDYADIDNDNDLDVIILGDSSTVVPTNMDYVTTLYTNDGNGNFTIDNSTQFPAVGLGSVTFADVDNNGYPDLQFSGDENMFMNNLCLIDLSVSISNGAVLTANESGATYQWLDCDNANSIISGATSQTYSPASNGSYSVIITSGNCSDTSQCATVNAVGIENIENIEFNIFPNPSNGIVSVNCSNTNNTSLKIYNTSGKMIYSTVFNTSITFNLNEPSGVYFIELKSSNSILKQKLIKL